MARRSRNSVGAYGAKENFMRTISRVAMVIPILCLALPALFAAPSPAPKGAPGTIVIVFKDGHRQSFNLSEIERVEFPGSANAAVGTAPPNAPSRGRFLGKWECGDGNGSNFYIKLEESGDATRSIGDVHGKWVYVDGEARVSWDDGAQDAIRKVGSRFQKFAYSSGKSFTDDPDNVTNARNTSPHPI
jgi:hypothetical protein